MRTYVPIYIHEGSCYSWYGGRVREGVRELVFKGH